jgi:Tfp pilus assembly protein PilE
MTLIEVLIGVLISSIMIGAMYTTYNVVNNSYSQVTDKAKISRSGRDIVEMLMRDIRMAGYKYYLGSNNLGLPERSYLEFKDGRDNFAESHHGIVIIKAADADALGHNIDGDATPLIKNDSNDMCCDKIHIVYDDFDQNDLAQPYKRYRITYFAQPINDPNGQDPRYGVYRSKQSWIQVLGDETGEWSSECTECYKNELIRDHLVDMEFIPFDREGRVIIPAPRPDNTSRDNLTRITAVDVRLSFRSKREFFRFEPTADKPRFVKGLTDRTRQFMDKYLRDSVVVTIHTRNIGT